MPLPPRALLRGRARARRRRHRGAQPRHVRLLPHPVLLHLARHRGIDEAPFLYGDGVHVERCVALPARIEPHEPDRAASRTGLGRDLLAHMWPAAVAVGRHDDADPGDRVLARTRRARRAGTGVAARALRSRCCRSRGLDSARARSRLTRIAGADRRDRRRAPRANLACAGVRHCRPTCADRPVPACRRGRLGRALVARPRAPRQFVRPLADEQRPVRSPRSASTTCRRPCCCRRARPPTRGLS